MKYICFFDLLGTQELVKNSPDAYIDKINSFAQRLEIAATTFADRRSIKLYAFSDSVYLESGKLDSLCDFMRKLRSDLIAEETFFNAAICKGTLGIKRNYEYAKLGYFFEGKEAVKVFREQTSFTGIGIHISNELLPELKEKVVRSTYIVYRSQTSDFDFVSFYDLQYSPEILEEFDAVLDAFVSTYILNKRASRYYFSIICTMLKCMLLNKQKIVKQIEECINALKIIEDATLRTAMALKLFEIACDVENDVEALSDYESWKIQISETFDLFWNNKCFRYLSDLSKYSDQVLLPVLRNPLSYLITEKKR